MHSCIFSTLRLPEWPILFKIGSHLCGCLFCCLNTDTDTHQIIYLAVFGASFELIKLFPNISEGGEMFWLVKLRKKSL